MSVSSFLDAIKILYATGFAVMDSYKSIYLGNPLVEVARGEAAQEALGIAFGRTYGANIAFDKTNSGNPTVVACGCLHGYSDK